ncbi:hypothetical protein D3C81_1277130 [compost metagenome]
MSRIRPLSSISPWYSARIRVVLERVYRKRIRLCRMSMTKPPKSMPNSNGWPWFEAATAAGSRLMAGRS